MWLLSGNPSDESLIAREIASAMDEIDLDTGIDFVGSGRSDVYGKMAGIGKLDLSF